MHNENLHNKKVGSVYREIMKYLRDDKKDAKLEEDENISASILYDIIEIQKSVHQDKIQSLAQENIALKNEIKTLKYQIGKYHEKTQEILNLFNNFESLIQINKNKDLITRDTINLANTNNFDQTIIKSNFNSEADLSGTLNDTDELNENLNLIRELIREMNFRNTHAKASIKKRIELVVDNKVKPKENLSRKKINIDLGIEFVINNIPRLIPEEFISKCQGCEMKFSVCRWKYHCRVCGCVFCFYCTWNFDNFLPFYLHAIRICYMCIAEKKNISYLNN